MTIWGKSVADHVLMKRSNSRISRKRSEGLSDGGRDSRHEEEEGSDEGPHRLGGYVESVLESSDGSEHLRPCDEDENRRLDEDVDLYSGRYGPRVSAELGFREGRAYRNEGLGFAGGSVATASGLLVNLILNDGGDNHRDSSGEEAESDLKWAIASTVSDRVNDRQSDGGGAYLLDG